MFMGGEPMNWATKRLAGIVVDLRGRRELLQHALVEDGHAVGERHGLDLVVGDVDRRDAERLLHVLQLGAHVAAELGIEIRQRLVHQKDRRAADDGAGQRHALPLAAGKLARVAIEQIAELHLRGGIANLRCPCSAFGTFRTFRGKPMFSATVLCG